MTTERMDTQPTTKHLQGLLKTRLENIKETKRLLSATPDFQPFRDQLRDLEAETDALHRLLWIAEPKIVLAVDPAMHRSGFAFKTSTGLVCYGHLDGIHHLSASRAFRVAAAHQATPTCPIFAMIEYPTWKGKGTDQVRAAANCWMQALREAFPRRVRVRKVNPQTWMAQMIPGYRKADRPADLYVPLAAQLVDPGQSIEENAAAAICIHEYATRILRSGQWGVAKPVLGVAR